MSDISENARETAQRLGLQIIMPQADELFIDIDGISLKAFDLRFEKLQAQWPQAAFKATPSRQADHYHIIVKIPELNPLSDLMRIALQAALGSDWVREMLAVVRVTVQSEIITCFFEPPEIREAKAKE